MFFFYVILLCRKVEFNLNNILLIDGNAILTRCFYGIRPLTSSEGRPTNATYGFLRILNKLIQTENPSGICTAFDVSRNTFRKQLYPEYKSNRLESPEYLKLQRDDIKQILKYMNIPVYEHPDFEADDILGTISRILCESGCSCTIVTGDRDLLQLLSDNICVILIRSAAGKSQYIKYTTNTFEQEYGFPVSDFIAYKSILGDSSDNIPGVPGIGEKTACELVQTYHTVHNIFEALPSLTKQDGSAFRQSVRRYLEDCGRSNVELSEQLVTICKDVPVDIQISDIFVHPYDESKLHPFLSSLGLQSFCTSKSKHKKLF